MATLPTAIRSNSVQPGGNTQLQPTPPTEVTPEIAALLDELTPAVTKFRQASSMQNVNLDTVTMAAGADASIRIASVGIGVYTVTEYTGTFSLVNTAAAAQVLDISPLFPWNVITNTSVGINVGTVTYSADGPAGLMVAARARRTVLRESPNAYGLASAMVRVTAGANVTLTYGTSFSLSGVASLSVAATSTGVLTVTWYSLEKLAYSLDSMIGGLPLQNNSVYATLTRRTAPSLLGTDVNSPFYVTGGVPATITATVSLQIKTEYWYWGVPSDPALYAAMVTNSYQVLQQTGLSTSSTGPGAITYNLPQNELLIATHLFMNQGAQGAQSVVGLGQYEQIIVQYNGGKVVPIAENQGRQRFRQYLVYGDDRQQVAGYAMWDGDDTSDEITDTDSSGWVDTYTAASPQLLLTLAGSVTTPVTYSVTRESIGQAQVAVVG